MVPVNEALRALCQPLGFTLVGSEMTEFCKLRGLNFAYLCVKCLHVPCMSGSPVGEFKE